MRLVRDDRIPLDLFCPARGGIAPGRVVIHHRDERPLKHLREPHLLRSLVLLPGHGTKLLIEGDGHDRDADVALKLRHPKLDHAHRAGNQDPAARQGQDEHARDEALSALSRAHLLKTSERCTLNHPGEPKMEISIKGF